MNEGPILGFYPVSISLMQKHPGDFQFCDHTMDIESSLSAIDVENNNKNGALNMENFCHMKMLNLVNVRRVGQVKMDYVL